MTQRSLQVTFIDGRPLAAYFSLDAATSRRACATSKEHAPGLVIDYADDGTPLGIEITAPAVVTLDDVNRVLASLRLPLASRDEVRPLLAA